MVGVEKHTTHLIGNERYNRKKPMPRPSPGQGTTYRLRPLDDFERAAELAASDPFPIRPMFEKGKSESPIRSPQIGVAMSGPEEPRHTNMFDTGPLTPLEHTIANAFQSQSPKDSQRRKTLHIKHPERVTVDTGCNPFEDTKDSTDSWSDDDIFLKRPFELQGPHPHYSEQVVTYPVIVKPPRPTPRSSRFHWPSPAKVTGSKAWTNERTQEASQVEEWYRSAYRQVIYVGSFADLSSTSETMEAAPRLGDMLNDADDEDDAGNEATQIRCPRFSNAMQGREQ